MMVMFSCCLVGLLLSTRVAEASGRTSNKFVPNTKHDFRIRRGFKTLDMATARGFGKRSSWLADYDDISVDQLFPIEWLMEYLQHKPEALRYLLERTVDRNGDGHVSASEMASSFQD